MKFIYKYSLLVFTIHISLYTGCTSPVKNISALEIKRHIYTLADDSTKGRMTGSPESKKCADYIKSEFIKSGLQPGANGDFFQSYPFASGVELGHDNSLNIKFGSDDAAFELNKDYVTVPFSGTCSVSAPVVFAGYGITAKKLKYDDYDSIDVKGKVVIVFKYHPEMDNPHSEFDDFSAIRSKASTAKEKGALGIIFVNPKIKGDEDKLTPFQYDRAPLMKDIGIVQIRRDALKSILNKSGNLSLDLDSLQKTISTTLKPHSFEVNSLSVILKTEVNLMESTGINVVGLLPGNDAKLKDEYLVIGAHYDHLGMGGDGSLYRGTEKLVHNGADDNASGTAGVIELASKFASIRESLKRSVIFVTFSGEELGLLGSSYFAGNPTVSSDKIVSMINLDMIGRLKEDTTLIIYGTGTSSVWKKLIDSLNTPYKFVITKNDEGFGPSDHSSFYAKNMPVLFFFTGTHPDYHRPSDDADKINYPGEEKILNLVADISKSVLTNTSKPDYINVPRKQGERSGGWKVYVGTVPDYAYTGEGLKITGASEGSPAKKAGLTGGDIILQFGEKKINTIYDYVAALREYVPGDVVTLKVKRGNETITCKVELMAK